MSVAKEISHAEEKAVESAVTGKVREHFAGTTLIEENGNVVDGIAVDETTEDLLALSPEEAS